MTRRKQAQAGLIMAACLALAGAFYWLFGEADDRTAAAESSDLAAGALAEVALPASLSASARVGKTAFEAKCAACHGANAAGQDGVAPPLVHIIYEPSHHGDESFQRAVAYGVRGHHWPFGDMSPVEGLTRGDVSMIIAYIRELQRANGID